MWLGRGHCFNGSVPCCVLALALWQRGVIFHITAHPLPDMSKMDKINIHTATKTPALQNQCHLFDQRLFPQARAECARMPSQCELAGLYPDSCMWNKCPLGYPHSRSSPCRYCSCQRPLRARRAEWRERAKVTVTRELASNSLTVTSTTSSDTAMSHA